MSPSRIATFELVLRSYFTLFLDVRRPENFRIDRLRLKSNVNNNPVRIDFFNNITHFPSSFITLSASFVTDCFAISLRCICVSSHFDPIVLLPPPLLLLSSNPVEPVWSIPKSTDSVVTVTSSRSFLAFICPSLVLTVVVN